ncbi:TIGR01244 family sulfur transferase [Bartonella apihabitans]|uniref:TIGR01244 family sulfur transferase n=1 Tax=Bartonella apihabitans TaxID=2750929 RepID=UPI00399838D5
MDLTEIDDGVFVCGQITEDFVEELAKAGFKTIICNRPDNEQQNQPTFASIEKVAKAHGLTTYYIPVTPPNIEQKSIASMRDALKTCEYPVLAYCKSGHRAQTLYHLAKN